MKKSASTCASCTIRLSIASLVGVQYLEAKLRRRLQREVMAGDSTQPTNTSEVYDFLVRQEHNHGCTCKDPPMVIEDQDDGKKRAVLGHFEGCPRGYGLEHRN